jgi:hypothetical protein
MLKPDFVKLLSCLLLIKLILLTVSWISISNIHAGELNPFASHIPLFAWDSLHYLDILNNGYPRGTEHPERIAFFPLYPILSWPLAQWLGGPVALLIVSNLASLVGYLLFYIWCERRAGSKTALFASLAAISYPPAFFTSCAYTEGPFVLAIAATLLLIDLRRILEAALVAGIASALRPPAFILAMLVALASLKSNSVGMSTSYLRRIVLVAPSIALIGLSGAVAYQTFLTLRFDDPFIYFTAQKRWEIEDPLRIQSASVNTTSGSTAMRAQEVTGKPVWRYAWLLEKLKSAGAWNKFWMMGILALTILALWRPGPVPVITLMIPIGIFLLGYIPGHGARASSMARFLVGALPTFLYLGSRIKDHPKWSFAGMVVCWLMQCRLVWEFSQGSWTG